MAFKVDVVQLLPTDTQIAAMPANAEGSVHGLVICNNQTSARTFTLRLYDASEGTTSLIVQGITVAATSQFTWTKPINLQPNDVLYGAGGDIVVLASIYEGVAVPAAVGFTGRGAWSAVANYAPNDVVSYNNNSYLANIANINSLPTGTDWTLLAAQGTPGSIPGLVRTPTAVSPLTSGGTVSPSGPLVASAYAPLYSADLRNYRTFQVATTADTTFATPVFAINVNADSTVISPGLTVSTGYRWRCKDVALSGAESDWMTVQTFTTNSLTVSTPTITVEGGPVTVGRSPLLTGSAYVTTPDPSATHLSTNWEVRKTSDNSLVWSSYDNTVNLTSITVPYDVLAVSTSYAFRAQYNSTVYGSSAYGSTTASTASTFPNTVYAPATIATENLYLTTAQKNTSSITDDAFVMAYAEVPVNSNNSFSATLKLSVWNRVGGVFVESVANIVTAATDMANDINCYDVEMLTPTQGVVTWKTYFEGTGSGFIYVRPFNISGSVITLATAVAADTVTTTARQRFPKVTRLDNDLALLSYFGSTEALQPLGRGIKFVGTSMTISGGVTLGAVSGTGSGSSPIPIEVKRITNNTFMYASWFTNGTSTFDQRLGAGAVNTSTAVVGIGTGLTFSTGTTTNSICKIAVLTPTLAVFGCTSTYNQITISGTTTTFGTGGAIATSTNSWAVNNNYDFIPITATTALAFFQTTARIITVTATTSEGISQTLQPQTSTTSTIVRISDTAGPVSRFEQWSQINTNTFNTMISLFAGGLTSTAVTNLQDQPFGTEFINLSRNNSTINLSNSRAVVMTREAGYSSSTTNGRVVLSIWDISGNVPTFIARTATTIAGATTSGQNTLCALTTSRVLMTIGNAIYLFSVSDAGFTQLATTTIPNITLNIAYGTSVVRISDTSAIICYRNSSGGVGFVPANLTGDTFALSTAVTISSTTLAVLVLAVPLSATRVLVAWTEGTVYRASLVGFTTVWAPLQSDVVISSTGLNNQGPGSFVALDSTRALLGYQLTSSTGAVRTINTASDTITSSADRGTPTLTTNTAGLAVYALALDSTNGLVAVQESTGTALYSFTVGASTAQPSVLTKVADLNTNLTQSNPTLRMIPVAAISTGVSPTAAALTQERNAGANQNSDVYLRRFLKGSP
jgi:hypothetical protein